MLWPPHALQPRDEAHPPLHMSLEYDFPNQTFLQVSAHTSPDPLQAGSEPQSHQLLRQGQGPREIGVNEPPHAPVQELEQTELVQRETWTAKAGLKVRRQQGAASGTQSSSPDPRTRTGVVTEDSHNHCPHYYQYWSPATCWTLGQVNPNPLSGPAVQWSLNTQLSRAGHGRRELPGIAQRTEPGGPTCKPRSFLHLPLTDTPTVPANAPGANAFNAQPGPHFLPEAFPCHPSPSDHPAFCSGSQIQGLSSPLGPEMLWQKQDSQRPESPMSRTEDSDSGVTSNRRLNEGTACSGLPEPGCHFPQGHTATPLPSCPARLHPGFGK